MKRLFALGLVVILSGCGGAPESPTESKNMEVIATPQLSDAEVEQQKIKAESDRILAEAQAEYVANHEAELEPVDMPELIKIETKGGSLSSNLSESELLTLCQINIKNSMKNPKSFDMNYGSRELFSTTNGYAMKFSYTGTNSFNATITSVATCNFDKDGRLTKISSTS